MQLNELEALVRSIEKVSVGLSDKAYSLGGCRTQRLEPAECGPNAGDCPVEDSIEGRIKGVYNHLLYVSDKLERSLAHFNSLI
jgi:hypothetical protein